MGTIKRRHPIEAEIAFCVRGVIGEPCGMPRRLSRASVVRVFRPRSSVSSTGQSSHILIRCSTRRSTIRRATDFKSSAWGMLPNEAPQTTHSRDVPTSVVITRRRHPFEGSPRRDQRHQSARRAVVVGGAARRQPIAHSVSLDGLVWELRRSTRRGEVKDGEDLCAVGDLITRAVIDALLSRLAESAPREEGDHAVGVGVSRTARLAPTPGGPWDGLGSDRSEAQIAALDILSRLIAQMLAAGSSGREAMSDRQDHLQPSSRVAVVYLRQSSAAQVEHNRESTDRQYALAHKASELGWPTDQVVVIDEDLGLSGSGAVARSASPG